MSNILGVIGSPRKNGNTHVLVSTILEGAAQAGAAVDTLFLDDLTIRECVGCHACWSDKPCPHKDDMNDLYPKIAAGDAIIFGTPVYWYAPTALMKAFIDRFVYFNCPQNRLKIRGKSAVLAVPLEEDNPEGAALLVAFFEKCFHYLEMNLVGQIIVPGVTRRGEIRNKKDTLRRARELGQKLA